MFETETEEVIEVPKWDVALEALLREEYVSVGRMLMIEDFHKLSMEYSIRFDDIMDTVFAMTLEGKWVYRNVDGFDTEITQDMVDGLYVNARLHENDVRGFNGGWLPAA